MEGQALKRATRPAVEVLLGCGAAAAREIDGDFAMLTRAGDGAAVRTWTCADAAVVLGVSRELDSEVNVEVCDRLRIAVLRRASGGGTVWIGPGTLQYAFALPHPAGVPTSSAAISTGSATGSPSAAATPASTTALSPPSIDDVKRFCSDVVSEALAASGIRAPIDRDASGDLRVGSRKVAGVALRRLRDATLLHGTLLVDADLERIAAVLRHPAREPAWRQGRSHLDFLVNLGHFDMAAFAVQLQSRLDGWPPSAHAATRR